MRGDGITDGCTDGHANCDTDSIADGSTYGCADCGSDRCADRCADNRTD